LLTALLLASNFAHATEVARGKQFGIGPSATGDTIISVTGKYWFNEKMGLSFHAGTSGAYHGARGSIEGEFVEFGDWPFARFAMYWAAGIDAGVNTAFTLAPEVGVGGGVGVTLQFHDVPAEVFVDAGLSVYPLNYCTINACGFGYGFGYGLVQLRPAVGGRWYF
jgi:hypothetical protein